RARSRGFDELEAVAERIPHVEPAVPLELDVLVDPVPVGLEPLAQLVQAGQKAARSTPRCTSRPSERNHRPPRGASSLGLGTSGRPSSSPEKRRPASSSPTGIATWLWWRPVS